MSSSQSQKPFCFRFVAASLFLVMVAIGFAAPAGADKLREARLALDRKQYDRALSLLESLTQGPNVLPESRRLKIKTLVRLSKPLDALTEYERLESQIGRDDLPLLRELAIGFITPLLTDMREQMRGAAYTALKEVESEDTLPLLEDGLSDGSGLVRALAVEGLGRLKTGPRSSRLRKAMGDQAAMVRATVLKVLGRSGDSSVIGLIERALEDQQPQVRVTAAGVLARLGQSQGWKRILQSAHSSNPEERATALRMLGETREPRALPLLRDALADHQPSVRGAAAAALGDLGLTEAASALVGALNDPVPAVRVSAVISLGELRAPDSGAALKNALADVNPIVRSAAVSALLRIGVPYEEVAGVVRELTQQADPGVRASVARAIGVTRQAETLNTLQALLNDPLPRPRIAAARALGHIGDWSVAKSLKNALKDSDEAVRATAGAALVRLISGLNQEKMPFKNLPKPPSKTYEGLP